MPPENVGEEIASFLLEEIQKGGVVDSTHQGLLFLLCALCEPDVSKGRWYASCCGKSFITAHASAGEIMMLLMPR
ncbi:hypothetical protein Patl1_07707 [Pistacia atlantica]|uniref:Uncharacterized protein n=1 Tax=Pistacia atlantica TaxID=434234 RepID=A0ACC1AJV6_9ROSI|nr:hypothetical protein Patl1_07707 [Pistacia atlantica]